MSPKNIPRDPNKPWGKKSRQLPVYAMDKIYEFKDQLGQFVLDRLGLTMKIPVFIQDPLLALENPIDGIQEITVSLENGFGSGPTSSRIAVIDFNGDTQKLNPPVLWDDNAGWFRISPEDQEIFGEWIPDLPHLPRSMPDDQIEAIYRQFMNATIQNPYYHQLNVWAIVQRVLEFYEAPQALGRPIPWGFDGNRLLIIPHAGYGENAFYDWRSKSLQFYYFGDSNSPGFTCLSHDLIAHLTGMAILDGIRPLYGNLTSPQTAAFQEFIGDLTALQLSLGNKDSRKLLANPTEGVLDKTSILTNLVENLGWHFRQRPHLRSAFNNLRMSDIVDSITPQHLSQVLTGAMLELLFKLAEMLLNKEQAKEELSPQLTPTKALWWVADRLRRIALQPLDLCPPCDIQFIDYAKAVIRNDILTNPVDELGYRQAMLDIFHARELCTCNYQSGLELPQDCCFREPMQIEKMDFIYLDINFLTGSRTAAYYFLNDNHKMLHIPSSKDVIVLDLYDNSKLGAGAERISRQYVLVYGWQERVTLSKDTERGREYGEWEGKSVKLVCGGTLVFDESGNLLSWFRKPGTEHLTEEQAKDISFRKDAWEKNPEEAARNKMKRPSQLELSELSDWEIGRQRKTKLLAYLSDLIQRNLVGKPDPTKGFLEDQKPVNAIEQNEFVNFEITPHLRNSDFDVRVEDWTVIY